MFLNLTEIYSSTWQQLNALWKDTNYHREISKKENAHDLINTCIVVMIYNYVHEDQTTLVPDEQGGGLGAEVPPPPRFVILTPSSCYV